MPTYEKVNQIKVNLEAAYYKDDKQQGGYIVLKDVQESENSKTNFYNLWLLTDVGGEDYNQLLMHNDTSPQELYWEDS